MRNYVIQGSWAGVGLILSTVIGDFDAPLKVLIAFAVMDYATGVMSGFVENRLSSDIGFKGICRKLTIFILVAVCNLIDVYVLHTGPALRTTAIFFYMANEGISIIENAARLGLPVPEEVQKTLIQLRGGNKK